MTKRAGPVTYPPQLARRQPPKRLGVGACNGFGRSRSERVFRNEFPYLGGVGPAAWAGFRLVGGNGIGRLAGCARRPGAAAGSSPGTRRAQGQEELRRNPRRPRPRQRPRPRHRPQPSRRRRAAGCRRTAPRTAGSADLCAVDQILPEGSGCQRQAGLLYRQGWPHRVRPARHRSRYHRARRRNQEDPARHASAWACNWFTAPA